MNEYDETEAEGISVSDVDDLVMRASAWDRISKELDRNGRDKCSAADVCALGFDLQVWVANAPRGSVIQPDDDPPTQFDTTTNRKETHP